MKLQPCLALLIIVSSVIVVVASATDPQCSQTCVTNNDCMPSLECSYCYHGTCTPGLACGSNQCIVNTDCNQMGNCTACNDGVCTHHCGQPCQTTKDCAIYGCDQCNPLTNMCVRWQCGAYCESDVACDRGYAGCNFCDQRSSSQPGVCKSGCGTNCNLDSQCPGRCPFCTNNTCGLWPPFSSKRT